MRFLALFFFFFCGGIVSSDALVSADNPSSNSDMSMFSWRKKKEAPVENKKKVSRRFTEFSFDTGIGIGYRQDRQRFLMGTSDSAAFSGVVLPTDLVTENFHSMRGISVQGFIQTYIKNFFLKAAGDYAWLTTGDLDASFEIPISGNTKLINNQSSNADGRAFDVFGYFGYAINLFPSGWETLFLLTPIVGYSYQGQKMVKGPATPNPISQMLGVLEFIFTSDLTVGQMRKIWLGPFVGGQIVTNPGQWQLELGYYYHFIETQLTDHFFETALVPGLSGFSNDIRLKSKYVKGHGQRLEGKVDYKVAKNWKIGLLSGYSYFKNDLKPILLTEDTADLVAGTMSVETQHNDFRSSWSWFYISFEAVYGF